jgi:gamma-glutamyltranspeptidase/glutathione hydrolase
VAPGLAAALRAAPGLREDPGMRAVFAPRGAPLSAGARLRQPALARTLRQIAAEGPGALYRGEPAAALAAGLAASGCALTAADLAAFEPVVEAPLRGRFAGVDVLTSPPNSAGVLLLQALAALEALDAADPLGTDAGLLAAILQAGSAQREQELADPRSAPFDPEAWLGAERIAALVEIARTGRREAAAGVGRPRPDGDTVAIVAADGDGGAVSIIQSLYHFFGAQILEPATGILMHNRGASFSLEPSHPNRLAPGRRPAHTLMPVLVERDGALLGALGTMGGRVQAQIHAQVLLRLLRGSGAQAAVDAPRWVVGALGAGEPEGTVRIEQGTTPDATTALRATGHRVVDVPRGSEDLGHFQAIWSDDGRLDAGSDHRADGGAVTGRRATRSRVRPRRS